MRGDAHAGFGRRAGETDRQKRRHRAPARPYWATDALDVVRRQVWNDARRAGQTAVARELKGARYALWRNPEDLTARQAAKLADIARTNGPLYRAYLLKEQLRRVFALRGQAGIELLDRWLAWAQRCRIEAFVKLGRSIRRHRAAIDQMLTTGTGNALVESNTKLHLQVTQVRDEARRFFIGFLPAVSNTAAKPPRQRSDGGDYTSGPAKVYRTSPTSSTRSCADGSTTTAASTGRG